MLCLMHSADRCWNCDRLADAFTEVRLRLSLGQSARYRLCGACYASVFRPLVRELESLGAWRDQLGTWSIVEDDPVISPAAE